MITRKIRAPERAMLESSKDILVKLNPEFDFKKNRNVLNSVKRKLKMVKKTN
jgi:hypothetical protein